MALAIKYTSKHEALFHLDEESLSIQNQFLKDAILTQKRFIWKTVDLYIDGLGLSLLSHKLFFVTVQSPDEQFNGFYFFVEDGSENGLFVVGFTQWQTIIEDDQQMVNVRKLKIIQKIIEVSPLNLIDPKYVSNKIEVTPEIRATH